MAHDELIEKTHAGLRWVLADVEPETRVHELTDEEVEDLSRIANRVIAPAVLEEAALVCDAEAVDYRNEWNRNLGVEDTMADVADDCADAIRALKTRYE